MCLTFPKGLAKAKKGRAKDRYSWLKFQQPYEVS